MYSRGIDGIGATKRLGNVIARQELLVFGLEQTVAARTKSVLSCPRRVKRLRRRTRKTHPAGVSARTKRGMMEMIKTLWFPIQYPVQLLPRQRCSLRLVGAGLADNAVGDAGRAGGSAMRGCLYLRLDWTLAIRNNFFLPGGALEASPFQLERSSDQAHTGSISVQHQRREWTSSSSAWPAASGVADRPSFPKSLWRVC